MYLIAQNMTYNRKSRCAEAHIIQQTIVTIVSQLDVQYTIVV